MPDGPANRVDDIFMAALDLAPADRDAYITNACAGDMAILSRVQELLVAHERAGGDFLRVAQDEIDDNLVGQRIGQFTIKRLVARGGMGVVYEAEQDQPRRRVAIKLIRPGIATPSMLRRFELEAELLGRLQHPGIAQVYDAGTEDAGHGAQPYFVMEYIEGEPLLKHVAQRELTMRQRLELLARICMAIQHAHQKGVIHRDLKPANILVTPEGQPKVVDFGVARATDADLQVTSQHTNVGQLVGTMPYMSPEQAAGAGSDLDTRSDVYALGVVGYELLAGRLPYDLEQRMVHEIVRIIREEEPSRLSSINTSFRGDVETIIARALEKEKSRRYQSASDMANDIHRHLHDEPIVARPPSVTYQFTKFARRNRLLVSGAALIALLVLGSAIVTSILYVNAEEARTEAVAAKESEKTLRQQAEHEARVRGEVIAFLTDDLLGAADPDRTPDSGITLRETLESIPADLDTRFSDALVAARIHETLGSVFLSLGDPAAAKEHLQRSDSFQQSELGPAHPQTLKVRFTMARAMEDLDDIDGARRLYDAVGAARVGSLGPDHRDTLRSKRHDAVLRHAAGDEVGAEQALLHVLKRQRKVLGERDRDTLSTINTLANMVYMQERFDEALPLFEEAFEGRRAVYGPDHPITLVSMKNLALTLRYLRRYRESELLFVEALERRRAILGAAHPRTRQSLHDLASLYSDMERSDDIERLYMEDLDALRARRYEVSATMLTPLNNLGVQFRRAKRFADAQPLLEEALAIRRADLGSDHVQTVMSMHNLSALYFDLGRYEDAAMLASEAVESARAGTLSRAWHLGEFLRNQGECLALLSRYDEAEASLLEAHQTLNNHLGADADRTVKATRALANLYTSWGRRDDASYWQQKINLKGEGG